MALLGREYRPREECKKIFEMADMQEYFKQTWSKWDVCLGGPKIILENSGQLDLPRDIETNASLREDSCND